MLPKIQNCEEEEVTVNSVDVDYDKRIIYFFGDVDTSAAVTTIQALDKLSETGDAIRIIINSTGGDFFEAVSIVNKILKVKEKNLIITEIIGSAFSGAADIFLAGTKREMSKYSLLMFHELQWVDDGESISSHISYAKAVQKMNKKLVSDLLKDTKLTYTKYKRLTMQEYFFDSSQALKSGLAHVIY